MKVIVTLFMICLSQMTYASQAQQAGQILNYFGSTCSTNGEWTRAATGHAQSLIEVMRSLRDNVQCRSIAATISDLSSLQTYVTQLSATSSQKEILSLRKQEQVLLQALSASVDISEQIMISAELRNVQLQLAKYEGYGEASAQNSDAVKAGQAMETLVINTQAFLAGITANQECIQSNTQILAGVASLVGSVASSVLPSYYGVLAKAGLELTGQVVDFARKYNINRHMNKISQSIASTAYHCAFESLSTHWCSAQDTMNAINLKELTLTNPEDDMWIGVKIIDRELPSLLKWLQKVRAGSTPTTEAESERQNRSIRRETQVRTAEKYGQGTINGRRDLFATAPDPKAQWQILKSVIGNLVYGTQDGNPNSTVTPLDEIYPENYAPYYLLGIKPQDVPRGAGAAYLEFFTSFDPFTQWPANMGTFSPDLEEVERNFNLWISEAKGNIQRELQQVLQVSPLEVMDDAINNEGRNLTTPRKAISTTIKFLNSNMPTVFATENHKRIYVDTLKILNDIAKEIDKVHEANSTYSPLEALKAIATISQIQFGTILVEGRITRSVRYALNDLVIRRTDVNDDLASQLLAADDVVKSIQRITPNVNFTAYRQDISNSQSTIQNTMQEFADMFAKSIRKSLKLYDALAIKSGEGPNGPNNQAKAALCLKLVSLSEWPKKIPFELCEGAQLQHINPKGPKSVVVTQDELAKPLEERICHYRNFLRRSYIFQNYQRNIGTKAHGKE
jgi:hypothetical protein